MDVASGHDSQAQTARKAAQPLVAGAVPADAVLLQLYEDVSGPEGVYESMCQRRAVQGFLKKMLLRERIVGTFNAWKEAAKAAPTATQPLPRLRCQ